MAKLGSYYGLCPLIDQKSLLGVSEDVVPGCVIVTLGRNMAIKYKLSDQKQIQSWSTKEKLSSPVIYDKQKNSYVAVFNHYFLRFWDEFEKSLEKVKKIKFSVAIHTITACENKTIAIFKNGNVFTLSYAIEIRKNIPQNGIIDTTTDIIDQTCVKTDKYFVGLLLKKRKSYSYLWVSPHATMNEENDKSSIKIELKRKLANIKLIGHLVMVTEAIPALFTLWSDGRLYRHSLSSEDNGGHFFSIIESISRDHSVSMVALNSDYIAMYGADSNQEGASLQIFNMQFKVTQSKQQLKLYTEGSKLWLIGNSLILSVGQNLAVVPFHLATEQLAALVGSHKLASATEDDDIALVTEMVVEKWEESEDTSETALELTQHSIKNIVSAFIKEGWSESAICEEIFPKLIVKEDDKVMLKSLDYFTDIPESVLVKLLSYCLLQNSNNSNLDIVNEGLATDYEKLIDKVLAAPYSDVLLLPNLRTNLKFNEALTLLQYLCYLLSENGHSLPLLDVVISESKIIDWICILFDAYYQQLLLSRDSTIIDNLEYLKTLISTYTLSLDCNKNFEPILRQISRRKDCTKLLNITSLKYSIENIKLY